MQSDFRNHQLYLAEKFNWLERQVNKTSKRSVLKIESLKLITALSDDDEQLKMLNKLVKEALLNPISNRKVLQKESFYQYNLAN